MLLLLSILHELLLKKHPKYLSLSDHRALHCLAVVQIHTGVYHQKLYTEFF